MLHRASHMWILIVCNSVAGQLQFILLVVSYSLFNFDFIIQLQLLAFFSSLFLYINNRGVREFHRFSEFHKSQF